MAIVSEKTKNALLQDFQKDSKQYWNEDIPVVDDLREECEAYLKTLLTKYYNKSDFDRFNKFAKIINNLEQAPDEYLQKILEAKRQEELKNELQTTQYPQQKLQILSQRWNFSQQGLTKPNSKTKLPPINNNLTTNAPPSTINRKKYHFTNGTNANKYTNKQGRNY